MLVIALTLLLLLLNEYVPESSTRSQLSFSVMPFSSSLSRSSLSQPWREPRRKRCAVCSERGLENYKNIIIFFFTTNSSFYLFRTISAVLTKEIVNILPIKNANGNLLNEVNIDAHRSDKEGVSKTFPSVEHVARCGVNKPHANNNRIERLNGTL
jgi:hypothetical protein